MRYLVPLFILLLLAGLARPGVASEAVSPYLRAVEGPDGVALQTCVRRLLPATGDGPPLILAATSHVGESAYYATLQNHINRQPVVLFEGAGVPDFLRLDPPGTGEVQQINEERIAMLTEWLARYQRDKGTLPVTLEVLAAWADQADPGHAWMIRRTATLPGHPVIQLGVSGDGQVQLESPGKFPAFPPVILPRPLIPTKPDRSTLQRDLARALGLEFQLDAIRMSPRNCYPCDISSSEMIAVLAAADEDPARKPGDPKQREKKHLAEDLDQLMDLMQGRGFAGKLARLGVALIGMSESLRHGCLLALAEIMDATGGNIAVATRDPRVKRLMKLLLEERNELILEALSLRLKRTGNTQAITLFYGAGHMLELEAAIRQRFQYVPATEAWLTVYTADPEITGFSPEHRRQLRESIMEQLTGRP